MKEIIDSKCIKVPHSGRLSVKKHIPVKPFIKKYEKFLI